MTNEQTRANFEAHIDEMIVSYVGLDIALNRDESGEYETSWVKSGWQFWQAATLKATEAERERCEVICCNNVSIIAAIQQIRKCEHLPAQPCKNKSMGKHACTNRDQCWEPCGELGHSAEHARPSMRNFCGRCGKRLGNIDSIHTCTLAHRLQPNSKEQAPGTSEFIKRTNTEYSDWCKTYYQADALDDRGMASLHGLWAWQEQEHRKVSAAITQPVQPKRQWVGLTREAIDEIWIQGGFAAVPIRAVQTFARAIEAKLKERNE